MTRVSFQEFLAACDEKLTPEQSHELRPYASYYLVHGAYVGLDYYEGLNCFYIWIAVGGDPGWWSELKRKLEDGGADYVYFAAPTAKGTKTFARRYKGTLEEIGRERLLCRVKLDRR